MTDDTAKAVELTPEALRNPAYIGMVVHFTNHPCRPSVPVTMVDHREGNIQFADGHLLCAFADELSWTPRNGLGQ